MISERISDDFPPQMKILNVAITILMQYLHFPFKNIVKCTLMRLRPVAASCIIPLARCIFSLVNQ